MFCKNCGQQIDDNATKCDKCGASVTPVAAPAAAPAAGGFSTPSPNGSGVVLIINVGSQEPIAPSGKNTVLATILSCCIPGVGQIYLGQLFKGIALLIIYFVLGSITFGIVGLVAWVVAMLDAFKIGKKLEEGKSVAPWEFF